MSTRKPKPIVVIPGGESRFRRLGRLAAKRLFFILLSIIVLYPLFWNLMSSFKTNAEILDNPPWKLPHGLHLINYVHAFKGAHMDAYLLNSLYVTSASLALLFFLTLSSAYALSRFRNKLGSVIKTTYMAGLFVQTPILMIPIFLLLANLGLSNSREGLILVYSIGALPFSVYLLTGYMASIPRNFEESAMIDGCGRWRILFSIIAPLAQPGLITVMIFNFFAFWNEYPMALTLIFSDEKRTLPIGLSNLFEIQRYATDWGALFAGLSIVLVPTLIVYAFTQKRLTSGIMMGGLKG